MQIFIEQLPLSRQLKIPSRNYKNLLLIQGKFYSFIQTNLISATSTTPLHPPPSLQRLQHHQACCTHLALCAGVR